jgi:hypothetical protein
VAQRPYRQDLLLRLAGCQLRLPLWCCTSAEKMLHRCLGHILAGIDHDIQEGHGSAGHHRLSWPCHVLSFLDDIRAKRITLKRVAAARETTAEELREYLVLAKLALVIRDQILRMATVTPTTW